jgi:hypothetical protein
MLVAKQRVPSPIPCCNPAVWGNVEEIVLLLGRFMAKMVLPSMRGNCEWDARITDAIYEGEEGVLLIMSVIIRCSPDRPRTTGAEDCIRAWCKRMEESEHRQLHPQLSFKLWMDEGKLPQVYEYPGGHNQTR